MPMFRKRRQRLYTLSLVLFIFTMLFSHPYSGPEAGVPALATQLIDPNAKLVYEVERSLQTGERIRNVERYQDKKKQYAIPYQTSGESDRH